MFFDSHAHYDDKRFKDDLDETLLNLFQTNISYILNPASNVSSNKRILELSQLYENLYVACGVHPHDVSELNNQIFNEIKSHFNNDKVVAVGEIGLDYFYDFSPRDTQKLWFSKQLDFAKQINKPVIIHDRDAHEDTLDMVKRHNMKDTGGVFHCFSGSVEMAREVLNLNFYISIAGPVTFKNSKRLIEVIKYTPLDRLLIETDSPYLTPEPFRGTRNDSSHLKFIAEKIAEIKEISIEEIAEKTKENAKVLFKIGK